MIFVYSKLFLHLSLIGIPDKTIFKKIINIYYTVFTYATHPCVTYAALTVNTSFVGGKINKQYEKEISNRFYYIGNLPIIINIEQYFKNII